MGKRELLIALAFVIVGAVVYQFSAPPAKTSTSGFSFSKLIDSAKREVRGNQSYAAPVRHVTFPAGADIMDLRLSGVAGPVTITGEDRADVDVALTVFSTGETEAAAVATANKTKLLEDRVGGALSLRVEFPKEETQTSAMVLKVPRRLAVRVDGNRETTVTGVRALELLSPARGTTRIEQIAERVSGTQNGGAITLTGIGSLKMTLTRTRARLSAIAGETTLDVQDGDTEIAGSRGALTIDARRGDITIRAQNGPVKLSGSDGRVRLIDGMGDVSADMRRAEIDAELAPSAAATLSTSDEELRVSWRDDASVRVDAVATNGTINAADWALTPAQSSSESRVDGAIGRATATAPKVSLRNHGANITLKKSSKK